MGNSNSSFEDELRKKSTKINEYHNDIDKIMVELENESNRLLSLISQRGYDDQVNICQQLGWQKADQLANLLPIQTINGIRYRLGIVPENTEELNKTKRDLCADIVNFYLKKMNLISNIQNELPRCREMENAIYQGLTARLQSADITNEEWLNIYNKLENFNKDIKKRYELIARELERIRKAKSVRELDAIAATTNGILARTNSICQNYENQLIPYSRKREVLVGDTSQSQPFKPLPKQPTMRTVIDSSPGERKVTKKVTREFVTPPQTPFQTKRQPPSEPQRQVLVPPTPYFVEPTPQIPVQTTGSFVPPPRPVKTISITGPSQSQTDFVPQIQQSTPRTVSYTESTILPPPAMGTTESVLLPPTVRPELRAYQSSERLPPPQVRKDAVSYPTAPRLYSLPPDVRKNLVTTSVQETPSGTITRTTEIPPQISPQIPPQLSESQIIQQRTGSLPVIDIPPTPHVRSKEFTVSGDRVRVQPSGLVVENPKMVGEKLKVSPQYASQIQEGLQPSKKIVTVEPDYSTGKILTTGIPVKALVTHKSKAPTELSITRGEPLMYIKTVRNSFGDWAVVVNNQGRKGFVPLAYISK